MKSISKSRLSISLCKLIPLLLVRSILEVDVQLLKNEFVNGYREGNKVLYISLYDNNGVLKNIYNAETWGEYWQSCNESFKRLLKSDCNYEKFSEKMFYIWEDNHRVTDWRWHIDCVHPKNHEWYHSIDYTLFEPTSSVAILLNAMYSVHMYVP